MGLQTNQKQLSMLSPQNNAAIPLLGICPKKMKTLIQKDKCTSMFINLVQWLNHVWLFVTPQTPGFPVHQQLLALTQTHVHWAGDAIQQFHPLMSLLLLPSIFPSIRIFPNESVLCIKCQFMAFQLQHQVFQWIFNWFPLVWTGWIYL